MFVVYFGAAKLLWRSLPVLLLSISLANAENKNKIFHRSVRGSYNTALSYEVIRDVVVSSTLAQVAVIWFDTLVSDQSLSLLHILMGLKPNFWS